MNGQVFVRDTGVPGLTMVVGIFQQDPDVQTEAVHVAQLSIVPGTAEDQRELARGAGIGQLLMEPIWRVATK